MHLILKCNRIINQHIVVFRLKIVNFFKLPFHTKPTYNFYDPKIYLNEENPNVKENVSLYDRRA